MEVVINHIERETEKAILVNVCVAWGNGNIHLKSLWMPKSAVIIINEKMIDVKDWMLNKLSLSNSYRGYAMKIGFNNI